MKSDFLLAITQLSAEKNLPKEVVIDAVEAALVSAYRKEHFTAHQNIEVKVSPITGKVEVWAEKKVVESSSDKRREISLAEARQFKKDAQIDDTIMVEATPHNAGRIAAQTAKQVILQRLHEAEHSAIFEEYAGKENDIITGKIENVVNFGAFIKIKEGVDGLLPSSKIKLAGLKLDKANIGEELKVRVVKIDREKKRISLEPTNLPESATEDKDDWHKYKKQKKKKEIISDESPFSNL